MLEIFSVNLSLINRKLDNEKRFKHNYATHTEFMQENLRKKNS